MNLCIWHTTGTHMCKKAQGNWVSRLTDSQSPFAPVSEGRLMCSKHWESAFSVLAYALV